MQILHRNGHSLLDLDVDLYTLLRNFPLMQRRLVELKREHSQSTYIHMQPHGSCFICSTPSMALYYDGYDTPHFIELYHAFYRFLRERAYQRPFRRRPINHNASTLKVSYQSIGSINCCKEGNATIRATIRDKLSWHWGLKRPTKIIISKHYRIERIPRPG